MTTPYLESKAHKISKYIFYFAILLLLTLLLSGCAKQPDPVETATTIAHQQIAAIKKSLPKECQTAAIDEQLKAHDSTVDMIKSNCDMQKAEIISEKIRWKWAFFALAFIVLVHVGRKVLK